jgi:hypothetical protein
MKAAGVSAKAWRLGYLYSDAQMNTYVWLWHKAGIFGTAAKLSGFGGQTNSAGQSHARRRPRSHGTVAMQQTDAVNSEIW